MSKNFGTITEIWSIKNELGHFSIGFYPHTAPDIGDKPAWVKDFRSVWDNPQDPIVHHLYVAPDDMNEALEFLVWGKRGKEYLLDKDEP